MALWPSMPAQAGMEPRPSFPSGDRLPYPAGEGLHHNQVEMMSLS